MDDERLVLLAVYSKDAAMERFSGMKGVVRLMLEYTSMDFTWKEWQRVFKSRFDPSVLVAFEAELAVLDHFIRRLDFYPRITPVEIETAGCLMEFTKRVLTTNWRFNSVFYESILLRLFNAFKTKPFSGHLLTQQVVKSFSIFYGKGRFGTKEVQGMNYANLVQEGIDIVRIHEDFKGCDAVLTTSRKEWVQVNLRTPPDYPFRSPIVTFQGFMRPWRFRTVNSMAIERYFDYAFTAAEDSLRALLLEMELDGVASFSDVPLIYV